MRILLREIESFLNNIIDFSSSQRYNIIDYFISWYLKLLHKIYAYLFLDRS